MNVANEAPIDGLCRRLLNIKCISIVGNHGNNIISIVGNHGNNIYPLLVVMTTMTAEMLTILEYEYYII